MNAAACGLLWALAVLAAAVTLSPPAPRAPASPDRRLGPASEARTGRRRARLERGPPRARAARAYLALGAVVAFAVWPPLAVGVVVGAVLARRWGRLRRHRSRHATVIDALPEVIDLIGLAATAGLTVPLTVTTLAQRAPPPYAAAFAAVAERARHGWRLADALAELPALLGEPVRPLAAALVATERYGVALAPTLDHLAYDARRERRRRAEAAARRLPVRLCFPLVCCILPAFGLLTIAPLLAGALRSLQL